MKVLFSAFDAGGGNAILPVATALLADKKFEVLCLAGGPSKKIFAGRGVEYTNAENLDAKSLDDFVRRFRPDIMLAGTSFGPSFDKKILPVLREIGAKTVYIMDYWANYWQRFSTERKDFKYLSDIICVMDERARGEMITEGFDPAVVRVTGNPHFDSFIGLGPTKENLEDRSMILFVSQPYTDKREEFGYNEFDVLDDLLEGLRNLLVDFTVVIRPHPSEYSKKFDKYLGGNIKLDDQTSIEDLISRAGLVIGMNSMVLFQSAVSGKDVVSYQPNLKTKDFAVSDDLGLSVLVTKKEGLASLLKNYFAGNFPALKPASDIIVRDATNNVIDIIKSYEKGR